MPQATRVIESAPGRPALLVQKARLRVVRGPDRGREIMIDRLAVRVGQSAACELRLRDEAVSRVHARIEASPDGYRVRDEGSTNGTFVDGVCVRDALIAPGQTLRVGSTEIRFALLDERAEIPLSPAESFGDLRGKSLAMRQMFAVLERVSPTDSTVLIEGESGTGKELVAEEIHRHSGRASRSFVAVDCAALPPALVESELFGHERGAFTGAVEARDGAFQSAEGGTLLLDEIGDLPLDAQPKLLRALEQREVRRLGGDRTLPVDVRVIAATHRDLEDLVAAGSFREDLFYRLAVVRAPVPPLRERREDVDLLAAHFLARLRPDADARRLLDGPTGAMLRAHAWPGNVRELRNVVERLVLFPELGAGAVGTARPAAPAELPFHEARRRATEAFEREYLARALEAAGGVVARAAAAVGLPRETLSRMARRLGLRAGDDG